VNEAENLDPRSAGRRLEVFEIKGLLAALLPLVSPLKWVRLPAALPRPVGLDSWPSATRRWPTWTWRPCTK
jgi:hypothetical protein